MELFTLESELPALVHDAHHPQGLLALAWALRQRDHRKAMALCEQVRHMLVARAAGRALCTAGL